MSIAARSHFEVIRPRSVSEAVQLKKSYSSGAWFWAGGTDLTLMWQRRQVAPRICIDLTLLKECRRINVGNGEITIGALTTLADLERSADRHPLLAVLSDVTKLMCTPQTRSLATVGGNLCNASPAADLSPCFVALDAEAQLFGPGGERRIPLESFFTGVKKTAIGPAEMMTEIRIPLPEPRLSASYRRIDRTVVDIALVNASCSLTLDENETISRARVALGAVGPTVIRSSPAERLLTGRTLAQIDDALLKAAGQCASEDARPISDVRASSGYRRSMIRIMVKRALGDCIARLGSCGRA